MVGDVHIENGHYSGFTDFHGAADLIASANNILDAAPYDSKLKADILANVIKRVTASPDLFAKAVSNLANRLSSATIGLNLDSSTIYDEVAALYLLFGAPRVETTTTVAVTDQSIGGPPAVP